MTLLDSILHPLQPGIARCMTPIKPSRLEGILKWMQGLGCEPTSSISIGQDGIERVIIVWDPSKQKDIAMDID